MTYRLKRGPKLVGAAVVAAGAFGAFRYATTHGWLDMSQRESLVPNRVDLPPLAEGVVSAPASIESPMPGTRSGCADLPETRALVWAWNAQMGWMFANGGVRSTEGSLMCKHGVNLQLIRQDDAEQMKAELLKLATEVKRGQANPSSGAHFIAIMGDGAAQFFASLNPQLRRLGPEYHAAVVASAGYSRGEDKFLGQPAWKEQAQRARGAYIAGYLKDGDWNIALKWAGDNGICNNPDDKVYDPNCLNWAAAKDYIDAAQKYVEKYCVDLPVKAERNKTHHACVDGVVTWTPGDVIVAKERGGLLPIVSTKEYASQMPNVIIGIEPWMSRNRARVEGMIAAVLEGGAAVKGSARALERAAGVSDEVYQEKGTGPDYWRRYYGGVIETDKQGLSVQLGGSKVNDLSDDVALFGMRPGYANAFEATYTLFGNIVRQQYPLDVPSFPAAKDILDTSYLTAVLGHGEPTAAAAAETLSYAAVAASPGRAELGRRSWRINFDTGKDSFRADAAPALTELMQGLVVAGPTAIEIHGHTDNVGADQSNQVLSEKRAFAVKAWLEAHASANFPDERFRIFAHGAREPVRPNDSDEGRAANRRVEIVLLVK